MASEPDPKAKNKTPGELVDGYKNQPIEFPAGTKWNYNNAGYYLLGYIVEKLSGKSYAQYLKENIFTPAGMNNTCFCTIDTLLKNKASGYIIGKKGRYKRQDQRHEYPLFLWVVSNRPQKICSGGTRPSKPIYW